MNRRGTPVLCEWAIGCGRDSLTLFPIQTAATGNTTYLALCAVHSVVYEEELAKVEAPIQV